MSYDVTLTNAGPVNTHEDGGTYALGGTDEPQLSITYNYSEVYSIFNFSINHLRGDRAGEWITKMQEIVDKCGTKRFPDYWAPTPGNAGAALARLLEWAKQYPDGIWEVQ